jgi:hypothetical protein
LKIYQSTKIAEIFTVTPCLSYASFVKFPRPERVQSLSYEFHRNNALKEEIIITILELGFKENSTPQFL